MAKPKRAHVKPPKKSEAQTEAELNQELVEAGWLTVDQFLDRYVTALRSQMLADFPREGDLHHPADLANIAWTFGEIVGRTFLYF